MLRSLALTVLLAALPGDCATSGGSEPQEPRKELVVTLVGDAEGMEDRLREGWFFRSTVPRLEAWNVTVRSARGGRSGPRDADAEVVLALRPEMQEVRGLLRDLPVEVGEDRLSVAGTAYDARRVSLIVRPPQAGARWLVASGDPDRLREAADRTLIQAIGGRTLEEDFEDEPGYEVRESRWLQRTGTWRRGPEGWEPHPSSEADGFAARHRWLSSLRSIDAGVVRLLVPPGREGSAEMRALAQDLGRAAAAMAPRVPLDPERLREDPVTVAVEADHVAQVRHAGTLGAVVPGWGRAPVLSGGYSESPDLHLVHHPDDAWAYRHAVARCLLERAGAATGAPRGLVDGAALWLTAALPEGASGLWYGRPFPEWLPDLAAADVLPEPGQLGVGRDAEEGSERPGDASEPLWVPAAASVVERLPGRTAAEKLAAADGEAVRKALEDLTDLGPSRAPPAPVDPEAAARGASLPGGWLRGVSLAASLTLEGAYHAPGLAERLGRLSALGADAVALMPFASLRAPDSPELRFLNGSPTSETDTGLVHAARLAHRRGFTVLWKPHVWVGHGSWPGEVEMTSEEDWRAWWRGYRRYVLHHAVLARYAGAELFCVGVELERTVERRADWAALIAAVRRVYPGALTYAANWGQGAERVSFWELLDAVGVDAYYPLAESADAGEEELREGAEEVARRLEAIAHRAGKPLLLTEVGFAAREGTWREPHREGGELSVDDQARAYRALFEALDGRPWLRGVFVWKAFSGGRPPWARDHPDFRFLGRPSEAVVAAFFRRVEAEGGAAPGPP